jgi:hypothetical protein
MIMRNGRPVPGFGLGQTTVVNLIPVAAVAVAAIGPFAGLGVGYALSKPGHRVWPMVAGFLLGGLAGSSAATVISWPRTLPTPAPAPTP